MRRGETVQSGIVFVDGLSVGDTSQSVLDERNALGAQGFATVAAAVSKKRKDVASEVRVEMHGITGGDDEYLQEDAAQTVRNALKRALAKETQTRELEKACKSALLSVLWERTKQRPMVIVSILDVP